MDFGITAVGTIAALAARMKMHFDAMKGVNSMRDRMQIFCTEVVEIMHEVEGWPDDEKAHFKRHLENLQRLLQEASEALDTLFGEKSKISGVSQRVKKFVSSPWWKQQLEDIERAFNLFLTAMNTQGLRQNVDARERDEAIIAGVNSIRRHLGLAIKSSNFCREKEKLSAEGPSSQAENAHTSPATTVDLVVIDENPNDDTCGDVDEDDDVTARINENSNLHRQIGSLKTDIAMMQDKLGAQRKEEARVIQENSKLREDLAALNKENAEFHKRIASVGHQNGKLRQDLDGVRAEKDMLSLELGFCKKEIERHLQSISDQQEELKCMQKQLSHTKEVMDSRSDEGDDGWSAFVSQPSEGSHIRVRRTSRRKLRKANSKLLDAARGGRLGDVQDAISKGADLECVGGEYYSTPFIEAAYYGRLDVVKYLSGQGVNKNARDKDSSSALICAAREGHLEVVQELVSAGVKVNLQNDKGNSALLSACHNGNADIVDVLVNIGANLDLQNEDGATALILASEKKNKRVVEALVKRGADLNKQDRWGESALIAATKEGHCEIMAILLERGADQGLVDKHGKRAIDHAKLIHSTTNKAVVELLT